MLSKYRKNLKLISATTMLLLSIVVASYLIILGFGSKVQVEELQPITTKTIGQLDSRKTQSTIGALIKVTEEVRYSESLNLDFKIVTDKGESLLVLINKKISLPESFVPKGMVSLEGLISAYPGAQLRAEAAAALQEMFTAAKQDKGINFTVASSYRSFQDQVRVFNGWVASAGQKSAESFSARAGHSQHQLGTTVDIGVSGKANFSEAFGNSVEGIWLAENSHKFGYVLSYPKGKEKITGYSYEPWHYRYIGKENALKMVESGLILEEYLQKYGTW